MATRVIPPRILRKLRYNTASKPFNPSKPSLSPAYSPAAPAASLLEKNQLHRQRSSASVNTATATLPPPPLPPTPVAAASSAVAVAPTFNNTTAAADAAGDAILNFDDAQRLFSFVPTTKLLRTSAVLHATAIEPMVDLGMWLMRSKLMEMEATKSVLLSAMKHTFFEHFCAGEDALTAGRSIKALNDAGLRGMLCYGVEDAHDNDACDRNLKGFLHTIDVSRSLPPSSVSYNIVKITAICPMRLLERVSDLLRWQEMNPSFNLPWKRDTLPIFSESSPLYHTQTAPQPLTPEEEHDLELAYQRLEQICQRVVESNIPLLIDAEYTQVQPAIDYFTYAATITHNRGDTPILYGTLQTYLKDAKERLLKTAEAADEMGIPIGFKLVRGAYMSSESKLAESLGYPSPVHDTIEDTHRCFNDCSALMLERIARGSGAVVLATHNIESGELAAAKAQELGMGKVNHKLEFAQLYGMSEGLSYGLCNAGFQVSKYMPFGPVEMVMPYLLRRAEENRGLLAASGFDRLLMRKELGRRLKASVF